jgi:hypothetical protein
VSTSAGQVLREEGNWLGVGLLRYVCGCGWPTETEIDTADGEERAAGQMREHLADEHGAELGAGRCAVCNRPTDWLRAANAEHGDAFLCEVHAPANQLREVIGADEARIEFGGPAA